ncbi:MAG TPA: hypothetical protein VEX35_14960 [Allosphingosinicella sp.]|nr:hypothetical protein [Allosphingosinicella sp.]
MTLRRSALLAGLLLTASPAFAQAGPAPARPDYVPNGIWRETNTAQFYEQWFGDQLHAMREPVLSQPNGLGRFRRRFRMLVLSHRQPSYAIRVDASSVGGLMHIVSLDGNGDHQPGRIARQRRLNLSGDDVRALDNIIAGSGLAGMPAEAPPYDEPVPDPATGETTIRLCHHATYFVFELVTERASRFVVRDACEIAGGLRTLIGELWKVRSDAGFP